MKAFGSVIMLSIIMVLAFTTDYLCSLRILVVFFHESSHALMTWLTGGEVLEFVVNLNQSGHVVSRGGSRFLTLSSGYVGAMIWGCVIFYSAVKSERDSRIIGGLSFLILILSVIFSNDPITLTFSGITCLMMLIIAKYGSPWVNDLALKSIGMMCIIYVPLDIWGDTIVNSAARSDAWMLADEIGGTGEMWGMVWIVISLSLVLYMTHDLVKVEKK